MKYVISVDADYDFKVEEESRVTAAEEMARLLKLLAGYGFEIGNIRCYFDDESE